MLWLTYTIAPAVFFAVLLLLGNLICAPYRIERDRRKAADQKEREAARELAEIKEQRPKFSVRIQSATWGGYTQEEPDRLVCTLFLAVFNAGRMPSIATDWSVSINYNGNSLPGHLVHVPGGVTLDLVGEDRQLEFDETEAIYVKSETPIPSGGMVRGHLMFEVERHIVPQSGTGVTINVSCADINGDEYSGQVAFKGVPDKLAYLPGTRVKSRRNDQD